MATQSRMSRKARGGGNAKHPIEELDATPREALAWMRLNVEILGQRASVYLRSAAFAATLGSAGVIAALLVGRWDTLVTAFVIGAGAALAYSLAAVVYFQMMLTRQLRELEALAQQQREKTA